MMHLTPASEYQSYPDHPGSYWMVSVHVIPREYPGVYQSYPDHTMYIHVLHSLPFYLSLSPFYIL